MLVIDAGNTSLHFAREEKGRFTEIRRLNITPADKKTIRKVISTTSPEKVLICSVVPDITEIFKSLQKEDAAGKNIFIAGQDIEVPIESFYNKDHIGMDRLVGAFAARRIYPSTRLIIDFGTAITFDFLSAKGQYMGGFILPGIGSSLRVLSSCALLPDEIQLKKEKLSGGIPTDTAESINKGIEEGFSCMVNALVKKYKKELKLSPGEIILITGGDAASIMKRIDFAYIFEPFLVFNGLVMLGKTCLK